jgi:hypothetical protein
LTEEVKKTVPDLKKKLENKEKELEIANLTATIMNFVTKCVFHVLGQLNQQKAEIEKEIESMKAHTV